MGKSFKSEKNQYSENKDRHSDYKRKKNKIREENFHDEFSEYKIHGFKNKYSKNDWLYQITDECNLVGSLIAIRL